MSKKGRKEKKGNKHPIRKRELTATPNIHDTNARIVKYFEMRRVFSMNAFIEPTTSLYIQTKPEIAKGEKKRETQSLTYV